MKRKYRAYFKLNLISIFFLAISFISITLAWFAYSGLAKVGTDIKVKSWYIEFEKDKQKVSNDVVISLSDIYPGMDQVNEKIDIKNLGDSDAQVNYSITSVRVLDEDLNIDSYEGGQLEDEMAHNYPFHINIALNKKYVKAHDDFSELNVSVSWPLDSDNDSLDSTWGSKAFNFQKKEEQLLKENPDYQVRSSIRLVISLKAEQYLTSNISPDMHYNLGDTILYDVVNNKVCKNLSDTCIKTHIIDVNNKIGNPSVNLLPDLLSTYQASPYQSYDNSLNAITSSWSVSTRPLELKDLIKIISTDISNSYFTRENLSDVIIGNMDYSNRLDQEIQKAKEKNGQYKFLNEKFSYLSSNKCYWIKEEYDEDNAFALTKIDDTNSKIYKELKSNSCNIIPVITVSKANLE